MSDELSEETLQTISAGVGEHARALRDPLVITAITAADIPKQINIQTPGHLPDYVIATVTPLVQIVARAGKTFCTSFVGFWSATPIMGKVMEEMTGHALQITDIRHSMEIAAVLALVPTITETVTTLGVLFSKLGEKYPLLKA